MRTLGFVVEEIGGNDPRCKAFIYPVEDFELSFKIVDETSKHFTTRISRNSYGFCDGSRFCH